MSAAQVSFDIVAIATTPLYNWEGTTSWIFLDRGMSPLVQPNTKPNVSWLRYYEADTWSEVSWAPFEAQHQNNVLSKER